MNEISNLPRVGAPDPEMKTSPIFDDVGKEDLSLDQELEIGCCYFNNETFKLSDYVCSGNELLRCEEKGIWIREGSCYEK